jgi:hypothetical protein
MTSRLHPEAGVVVLGLLASLSAHELVLFER